MKTEVLFIHGAGTGAYKADKLLANDLKSSLGKEYNVRYPEMPDEDDAPYELWKQEVQKAISEMGDQVVLVGHSIGGSHLAKILAEIENTNSIIGVFLLNAPFWGGKGWLYEGYQELELPEDFSKKFPKEPDVFLYHTRDDEVVPFAHLELYAKLLPQAILRKIDKGGHQLNNDLSGVAKDIKMLKH